LVRRRRGSLASEVLNRIGDKWSVYAIACLGGGTLEFYELRRQIDGISQQMLTATLRELERDGLVSRTMYPSYAGPPPVEYALTPLGKSLLDVVGKLIAWSETHTADIDRARTEYDQRRLPPSRR
jgi:DNA-binding HxlR family transcriptional regulator